LTRLAPKLYAKEPRVTPPLLFDLKGARVFVAGHSGMVGSAIVRRLGPEGCEILTLSRASLDLTRQAQTERWLAKERPDAVFLAAATARLRLGAVTPRRPCKERGISRWGRRWSPPGVRPGRTTDFGD